MCFEGQRSYNKDSAHPYDIYLIVTEKELSIPEPLSDYLKKRYQRELTARHVQEVTNLSTDSQAHNRELSTRERRTLLKALGIMTLLLVDDPKRSSQFKLNERPNASQIAQAVLDKAASMNIDVEGIKSLNRKIKEALDLLVEEEL